MNQPSMFEEYNNDKEIKPLFSIGEYVLGKYRPKTLEIYEGELDPGGLVTLKPGQKVIYHREKRGITNERQQILEDIRTIINQERKDSKEKKKYPPITGRALAIKLSHVPTEDLYATLSMGKDYNKRGKGEFGKFLFGSLKVKK